VSLVEKALKKMQGASAANSAAAMPVRRLSEEAPAVVKTAPATPAPLAPAEILEPITPTLEILPKHRLDKVVHINHTMLRSRGLLPHPEQERRLTAEYRQIKRPLMASIRGKGSVPLPDARLIMVASALPGEGKTFTSVNLALSMALEKDVSVLLVDGDIAKGHVSKTFDVQDEPGLMDLLLDESLDTASVVLPTSVPGLSLLPAGRESSTATEFLGSVRMEAILKELLARDPARVVMFDSPPLLLTTESRALSAMLGQIVLVVRAEETTHKAVLEALACVGEGKSIGLVLNQCEAGPTQSYYGYGEYGRAPDGDAGRQ
jgi:protein-tyrosine kinase